MPRAYWVLLLVGTLLPGASGCGAAPTAKKFRMGMMPKLTGIAYFNACERGARQAADELGIDLFFDGPPQDDVKEQIRMLGQWITEGYDCIAVAPNHPASIAPILREARSKGITI